MPEVLQGIVRGGKIELIDGPSLADGLRVQVMIASEPATAEPVPPDPTPEEGIIFTPATPKLLRLLEDIRKRRKPLPPSPTGPARQSAAGMLADDPTWDEHLREVLELRKSDEYRELPE